MGSSGSARIRSAIVQVVVAALDLGLPLQEAVELARVHPEGDVLDCEGGFPAATLAALEAAGEQVVRWPGRNIYFGGAQVAARTTEGFAAAGRPAPRRRRHRRGLSLVWRAATPWRSGAVSACPCAGCTARHARDAPAQTWIQKFRKPSGGRGADARSI